MRVFPLPQTVNLAFSHLSPLLSSQNQFFDINFDIGGQPLKLKVALLFTPIAERQLTGSHVPKFPEAEVDHLRILNGFTGSPGGEGDHAGPAAFGQHLEAAGLVLKQLAGEGHRQGDGQPRGQHAQPRVVHPEGPVLGRSDPHSLAVLARVAQVQLGWSGRHSRTGRRPAPSRRRSPRVRRRCRPPASRGWHSPAPPCGRRWGRRACGCLQTGPVS
jgi:hypothetical protein